MRVAVFTDNDFEKINGVTTTLTALLAHAPADVQPRIYTASALAFDGPDYLALASRGVPLPFYREMSLYVPRWRQYLRRVIEDGVDVIHLTTPGPLGLTALWIASRTGLPLVGSFHTDLATYTAMLSGSPRLGRWMSEYMRWMYGRCGQVLVPSNATRDALVAAGSRPDDIAIWPRGVDTNLFTPARRSHRLRERWRADADDPVLLYVGRLSREKGLEMLPPIVDRLRAIGIHPRVVIAGEGPLRRWLADQCADAEFTGPLGREAVADVFASADVFLFPSRTDTAGNVVLEAQAAGVPVVVSDAGGPRENMQPGVSGVVVEGEDPRVWASALATLLEDGDRRRAMGAAARAYAMSRRWAVALEPLCAAYRRACAPRLASAGAAVHAA